MQTIRSCHFLLWSSRKSGTWYGEISAICRRNFYLSRSTYDSETAAHDKDVNETKDKLVGTSDLVSSTEKSEVPVELNYAYFRNIVSDLTKEKAVQSSDRDLSVKKRTNVEHIRPAIPAKSGNLATYVNESEVLTKLVELGTDLSRVEKKRDVSNYLLQTDFDTGIQPYLEFLLKNGVDKSDLGNCLTKNPYILQENLDDLQVRVNYLEAKKFGSEAISRILTKAPLILTQSTKATDAQLGYLQKTFFLKGSEVRQVITAYPKLATWPKGLITDMRFVLKETCGFSDTEQKKLLLIQPKIYSSNRKNIEATFDYLHNKMGFSHEKICLWPQVFRSRLFIIRNRHKFLTSIGRAQYNPEEPNFVSLKMLVSGKDSDFCAKVAKVPVNQYNNFLKSL